MPKIKQKKLKNIDTKVGGKFYIFMLNYLETRFSDPDQTGRSDYENQEPGCKSIF